MVYPEGLRTVQWDREGVNIVESDRFLQAVIGTRWQSGDDAQRRLIASAIERGSTLRPVDLEQYLEEHYNVMA